MIISINTDKIQDPNEFGELLRDFCFDDTPVQTLTGYHKPLGCYSTFDLKPEFVKIKKVNEEYVDELLSKWYGSPEEGIRQFDEDNYKQLIDNLHYSYKNNIWITWFWDGDGDLIIECDGRCVENSDCKCDYTWSWLW